jgi:hypothetical protein
MVVGGLADGLADKLCMHSFMAKPQGNPFVDFAQRKSLKLFL